MINNILGMFFKHHATVIKKPKIDAGGEPIGSSTQTQIHCKISSKSLDRRDRFASNFDYNAVLDTYSDVDIAVGDIVVDSYSNVKFTVVEIHPARLENVEYKKAVLKWLV